MGLTVKKSSEGGFDEGWQTVVINKYDYIRSTKIDMPTDYSNPVLRVS